MIVLSELSLIIAIVIIADAAGRDLKLSLAETGVTSYHDREPNGPGTYVFGYDIDDPETDNVQFREEERKADGSVVGRYGWVAPDGRVYSVSYVADAGGYRANVEDVSYKRAAQPTEMRFFYKIGLF